MLKKLFRDFKPYTPLRRWPDAYTPVYRLWSANHEEKIITSFVGDFTMVINSILGATNILFLGGTFLFESWSKFADHLFFISALHKLYSTNEFVYTVATMLLTYLSFGYKNILQVYDHEAAVSREFHFLIHSYRNFTNATVRIRKQGGSLDPRNLSPRTHAKIEDHYLAEMFKICDSCADVMRELIRDGQCHVEYKHLVRNRHGSVMLRHMHASPHNNRLHGYYPDQVLVQVDLPGAQPKSLFDVVALKFLEHRSRFGEEADTWDLALLCNDTLGEPRFNRALNPEAPDFVRSLIIVPLILDGGLAGFFSLSSFRVGMLRDKHKHVVAAHADLIAVLLRQITRERF